MKRPVEMVDMRPKYLVYGELNGWDFFCRGGEWSLVPRVVAIALRALGYTVEWE